MKTSKIIGLIIIGLINYYIFFFEGFFTLAIYNISWTSPYTIAILFADLILVYYILLGNKNSGDKSNISFLSFALTLLVVLIGGSVVYAGYGFGCAFSETCTKTPVYIGIAVGILLLILIPLFSNKIKR